MNKSESLRRQPGNHFSSGILCVLICLSVIGCHKEPLILSHTQVNRDWGGAILFRGGGTQFLLLVLRGQSNTPNEYDTPNEPDHGLFSLVGTAGGGTNGKCEAGVGFSAVDTYGKKVDSSFQFERNVRRITSCTLDEAPLDVSDCNTVVLIPRGNRFIAKKLTCNSLISPNLLGSFLDNDPRITALIEAEAAKEKALLAKCLLVIEDDDVQRACFSPDGKQLATASLGIRVIERTGNRTVISRLPRKDNQVTILNASTGQETQTLKGHTKWVTCIVFSADGKQLVSGSHDKTVKIWNAHTGEETQTLKGHTKGVICVALSPDGKQLASASRDGTVKTWNANTGQQIHTFDDPTEAAHCVSFSPDGKQLVTGGDNGNVTYWDAITGQKKVTLRVGKFNGGFDEVRSVSFSPDGAHLAVATGGYQSQLVAVTSGDVIHTLQGAGPMGQIRFSPDGKSLATGGFEGDVVLWDVKSGKEVRRFKRHHTSVGDICFSPDGKWLASAGGTLHRWDMEVFESASPHD